MGYDFEIPHWYKIKDERKEYPWPCKDVPNRTIAIYNDDVLTRSEDRTFMKHTGLGCFGIQIPDDDLIEQDEPAKLRLL